MKNIDAITITIYNNGNADIELANKTIYTNKNGANSFIATARKTMKQIAWKKFDNGDQKYWFN